MGLASSALGRLRGLLRVPVAPRSDPGEPAPALASRVLAPLSRIRVLREFLLTHGDRFDGFAEGRRWKRGAFLTGAAGRPPGLFLVTEGEVHAQWWFGGAHASGVLAGPGSLLGALDLPVEADAHPPLDLRVAARATTSVVARFLPAERAREADEATGGALRLCLDYLGELAVTGPVLLNELSRVRSLRAVTPGAFTALLADAERRVYPHGALLLSPEQPAGGILGVLQGGTLLSVDGVAVERRGPGQVYGERAVFAETSPAGVSVEAVTEEVVAAFIPNAAVRAAAAVHDHARGHFDEALSEFRQRLLLVTDGADAARLVRMAAQSTRRSQHDGGVLVRLHRPGQVLPASPPGPDLEVVDVEVPANGEVRAAIDAALGRRSTRWVFLDPYTAGLGVDDAVVSAVDRVVHLAANPLVPPGERILWGRPTTRCLRLGVPETLRAAVPARTGRIRITNADLLAPEGLDAARSGRFSRVLTERQVGIALGGGGSWGYAHVSFLRALDALAVPVDLVSGSSFGAIVGAFYCAHGVPGLAELCALGEELNDVLGQAMFSSAALTRWMDRRITDGAGAPLHIEDLDLTFLPVSTDLNHDMLFTVTEGTLGYGARLSGAMPPTITPVIEGDSRFIDGGFRANVPVEALLAHGTALRFSSNIVPPGRGREAPPLLPGRLGRALKAFNPVSRVVDLLRAEVVAFHTMGTMEARFADVAFEPLPRPVKFWDFSGGEVIAHADYPQALERAQACRQLYVSLCSGGWSHGSPAAPPLPRQPAGRSFTSVLAPTRTGA